MTKFDSITRNDIIAGITTTMMLVPQAMGYAMLAGLPPVLGLYASTLPLIAYALAGRSHRLAIGPVAMDSLLTAAAVGSIAQAASQQYIELAALLALMVGVLQYLLGFLRFGSLSDFISRPVMLGFTFAAAVLIASSQFTHLLGLPLDNQNLYQLYLSLIRRWPHTHIPTLIVGLVNLAGLFILKSTSPKIPRAFVMIAITTILIAIIQPAPESIAVVGSVPSGLPSLALYNPSITLVHMESLLGGATTIAFIAFVEAMAVLKNKPKNSKDEQSLNPNREFMALGLSNIASFVVGGFPVTSGFSRSLVHTEAGATTRWAGAVTSLCIGATLLFMMPLFYYLPKAVLAAVIIQAVTGLFDFNAIKRLWFTDRRELLMLLLTFITTLTLGISQGVLVGVLASLFLWVRRTSKPEVVVIGKVLPSHLPEHGTYRNIERYTQTRMPPGVLAIRIDGSLYFGCLSHIEKSVDRLYHEQKERVHTLLIDASGINRIDISAEYWLRQIIARYEKKGVQVMMTQFKGPVRDLLDRSGFWRAVGPNRYHCTNDAALQHLHLDM